jgi:hypothetical protein
MWPQEGAIRIKIKFRGFLTQCTATNTQDAYFLRIRQMTDKSGGTFNKGPQRIMLTRNFGGVSERFRLFCGGSATNSRLRKGDETQPHNLNHHMEEKMKVTTFSRTKETFRGKRLQTNAAINFFT